MASDGEIGAKNGARHGASQHAQIGGGTPDDRRAPPAHEVDTGGREPYGVHDGGARVQRTLGVQALHFAAGGRVDAFGAVDYEGPGARRGAKAAGQTGVECQGMGPRHAPHHAHGEVRAEHLGLVRIVMAHGGDAAQQVLEPAPPKAHGLGHTQMLADRRAAGMVDVARPLGCVAVRPGAERGEEIELQMVVRVDEAGQAHMAGKIERAGIHVACPHVALA